MSNRVESWQARIGYGFPLLLCGAGLLLVSNGRWILPLAAWLYSVVLVRYVRTAPKLWKGLAAVFLVFFITTPIMWLGLWPFPPLFLAQIAALSALYSIVPFLLDRLSENRVRGLAQTLVFPSSAVALGFLFMRYVSKTTWGNLAYTQTESLALLQITSIAGIWGITFVMLWLAPVANNLWRSGFSDRRARAGVVAYCLVLGAIVSFGSARLFFSAPSGETYRVAMVIPPEILDVASPDDLQSFQQLMMKQEVAEERVASVQAVLESTYEQLFEDTRREARAGAELVVWPEAALVSFDQDQDRALIAQGRRLASEEGIYLAMTIFLLPGPSGPPNENRLILIDPAGAVVQTYWKHHTVPVIEQPYAVPGSEQPLVHETALTTLGGVICYDMDLPGFLQGAGLGGVDLLVAPSGDGPTIKELHAQMALVRGVEQGFSVVRPSNHGMNLVTDYQGRVIARLDHYSTSDRRLSAAVPRQGKPTFYQRTGDALPWLCLALTVFFLGLLVRRRRVTDAP